uniref:Uncharacterized protein n=1 Tax=Helianthus annuus TaxID=4232 RepID=A0A251RQC0_HELAN
MDLEGFLIPLLSRFGSYSIQFHCWVCRYWSWFCISWSEASDRVYDFQLIYAGYIIYILLASVSMRLTMLSTLQQSQTTCLLGRLMYPLFLEDQMGPLRVLVLNIPRFVCFFIDSLTIFS